MSHIRSTYYTKFIKCYYGLTVYGLNFSIKRESLKEELKDADYRILNFRHFNKIKNFCSILFGTTSFSRNVTWDSQTNIFITCIRSSKSRANIAQCCRHNLLLEQVITWACPFFFDHHKGINHPANVILLSTLHFMYARIGGHYPPFIQDPPGGLVGLRTIPNSI